MLALISSNHPLTCSTGPDPNCFKPNADIAGRGVVSAIYVSVFLNIFVTLYSAWKRRLQRDEVTTIVILRQGTLVLSGTMATVGIIKLGEDRQARKGDEDGEDPLSAYHASVILVLGLLLEGPLLGTFTSTSLCKALGKCMEGQWRLAWEEVFCRRKTITLVEEVYDTITHDNLLVAALLIVARFMNAIFTIMVLVLVEMPNCGCSLKGSFGIPVLGTFSRSWWALVSAVRLLDVGSGILSFAEQFPSHSRSQGILDVSIHWFAHVKLSAALVFALALIVEVEGQRWNVSKLMTDEEGKWGFGQIMALCVCANQIADVAGIVAHVYQRQLAGKWQQMQSAMAVLRDMRLAQILMHIYRMNPRAFAALGLASTLYLVYLSASRMITQPGSPTPSSLIDLPQYPRPVYIRPSNIVS